MILEEIVARRRRANQERRSGRRPGGEPAVAGLDPGRAFGRALRPDGGGLQVIAEFKRRSPSAGEIAPGAQPELVARQYEQAKAAALSVLTEEHFFGGGAEDLRRARAASLLPVLRKDFLLDEDDVVETRAMGADAMLLIVRILSAGELERMLIRGASMGLEALVEAHDRREVDTALEAGARLVGFNHRDLDGLSVDLESSRDVRSWVGPEVILVAESGIRSHDDYATMRARGFDAVLVGEALMRSGSPGVALAGLVGRMGEDGR